MITIPLNTNTGIRIPARTPPEEPKKEQTEKAERIAVSIQDAAKMLSISKPHFLPLIKEGKIRTVQIGRRILVSVQSLRDFVDGKEETRDSVEKSGELRGKNEFWVSP
jgi:excisionase family DNA binding protein